MLDWLVTLKEELRKKNKNVENELQLLAHGGSAFDTYVAYIVLNGL